MRFFLRIDFDLWFNASVRKKLLRLCAGLSATAVVAPVNLLWHVMFHGL
jgi:hypothetical protein